MALEGGEATIVFAVVFDDELYAAVAEIACAVEEDDE